MTSFLLNALLIISLMGGAWYVPPSQAAVSSALDLVPVAAQPIGKNVPIGEFAGYDGPDVEPLGVPLAAGPAGSDFVLPLVTCKYADPNYTIHRGLDIAIRSGEPVYSTMGGLVVFSGWGNIYGYLVIIENGSRQTWYAHNLRNMVFAGEHVEPRQMIALGGSSGESSGPHSHYAVLDENRAWLNPDIFVPQNSYRAGDCASK